MALWILLALLGSAVFLHLHARRFGSLLDVEAVDNAQVGLNLLRHRKLVTDVIYPTALAHGDTAGRDVRVGPLYPIVLAGMFAVRGASDNTVAMCNGMLHLLCAWALYLLMSQVGGKRVALFAVVAYLLSMEAVGQALTATPVTTAGLLVTLGLLMAVRMLLTGERPEQSSTQRPASKLRALSQSPLLWAAALGLALGLAYLTGVVAIYALAAVALVAVCALPRARRLTALVTVAAAMLIVIVPWLAYNVHAVGKPVPILRQATLLMHTEGYPGFSAIWSTERLPNPIGFAVTHPGQMLVKLVKGMTVLYRQVPQVVNPFLFPFLLWGALFAGKGSGQERLAWRLLVAALVAQIAAACLTDFDATAMNVVAAPATGLAVGALLLVVWDRVPKRGHRWAIGLAMAALLVFPYLSSVSLGTQTATASSEALGGIRSLSANIPGCRIASDAAWQVAWYGESRALLLPQDPDGLAALDAYEDGLGDPDLIYVSRDLVPMRGVLDPWNAALRRAPHAERWTARLGAQWPDLLTLPNNEYLLMKPGYEDMLEVRERTE
jgi:4-amino-4-deoxy-L-arabinose transferase-like glycosyltransferase